MGRNAACRGLWAVILSLLLLPTITLFATPNAKGADPKSFVDESLVKEVEASGFIKTLYDTEYR